MKWICTRLMVLGCLVASLFASAPRAMAEDLEPVLVVSLAGVDRTMGDVGSILKMAGKEDLAKTMTFFGNAFTNGINKKKPAGLFVLADENGQEFPAVVFIPVDNLDTVLATYKEQIGEPQDAGDDVKEFSVGPQSAFVKEADGWAFIAQSKDHLEDLPEDPAALLGDLPKRYAIGIRASLDNLPEGLKQTFLDAMNEGFERSMEQNASGSDEDRELQEKLGRVQIDQIKEMIEDLDSLDIGIGAGNNAAKLEIAVTVKEGTNSAKKIALQKTAKTALAGFLQQGSALNFNGANKLGADDIEQVQTAVSFLRARLEKEIDDDAGLEENKRADAKEVVGMFMDVLDKTVKEGKIDFGGTLVLEPKSIHFAAAGAVASGADVEKAVARLVELAKDEPEFPKVKLNSGSHAGVKFHTITGKINTGDDDVKEIFGDEFKVVLGTGSKTVYMAFGKDAEGLLKKVIDGKGPQGQLPPAQFNVSLLPILKFAASVDGDNPILPELISTLEKGGSDQIQLVSSIDGNTSRVTFTIADGVLKVIGKAAELSQQGGF
ncbi:MAG: hypothetical protein U0894_02355 [Pirellulales bacterium]